MAIGLGRLFGVELPQNFNQPYRALNPSDFWRRWHITLSLWLRDYLYISLGGNRCSPLRKNFNLMATMVLGGLWHGASWTFAAWGFMHGSLLIAYHYTSGFWDRCARSVQIGATFLLTTLAWVFFRAPNFRDAADWFHVLALGEGLGLRSLDANDGRLAALLALCFLIVHLVPNASRYERFQGLRVRAQVAFGTLTVMALLFMNYSSKFLYFQF